MSPHIEPYVAITDPTWFEFHRTRSVQGVVDEVNFWSPSAQKPLKRMTPGEPVFFRLPKPHHVVAGYGFFAHFALLELDVAWETFGGANGFPDRMRFLEGLGAWRRQDVQALRADGRKLACTILRDAMFWPGERWIRWGEAEGWPKNVTQGATIRTRNLADRLLAQIHLDQHIPPEEFAPEFTLVDADEREIVAARSIRRVGQGAFRARLLSAYESRCAITGERTEPVLDAAHVQPYLGPSSNHLQNGLLLTKEFHTLFDLGLVTVTPEHIVRVSPRIRDRWSNGKRYYEFDNEPLRVLPKDPRQHPSREALSWHNRKLFVA